MANIELAKKLYEMFSDNPMLLDMNSWVEGAEVDELEVADLNIHACGTTACLAGWAAIEHFNIEPTLKNFGDGWHGVEYVEPEGTTWEDAGIEALGIGDALANSLFFVREWMAMLALKDLADGVDEDVILNSIRSGVYYQTYRDQSIEEQW